MLPRRTLVRPDTAEVVTVSLYRGELLVVRQDGRAPGFKVLVDDEIIRRATRQQLEDTPRRGAVEVLSDQFKEQGFELVSPRRTLLSLLESHEPWRTWSRVAHDKRTLVDWWAKWGAKETSVARLLEQVDCAVVGVDALQLKLKKPNDEIYILGPGGPAGACEFLRSFCSVHERIGANELEAGLVQASFAIDELARAGVNQAQCFLNREYVSWSVDGDGTVWRCEVGGPLTGVTDEPAEVVMRVLLEAVTG